MDSFFDDYKVGKNVQKGFSNTSHHCGKTFQYYNIPFDKIDTLNELIVKRYEQNALLYLNEHSTPVFKLHFDVDDICDLQELVNGIQYHVGRCFLVDQAMNMNYYAEEASDYLKDPHSLIVLCCPKNGNLSYHLIWPFILVNQSIMKSFLDHLQENFEGFKLLDTQQANIGSLRMFLNDKWNKKDPNHPHSEHRPFLFKQLFDGKARQVLSTGEMVFKAQEMLKLVSIRWDGEIGKAGCIGPLLGRRAAISINVTRRTRPVISGNNWLRNTEEMFDVSRLAELCIQGNLDGAMEYVNKYYAKIHESSNPLIVERIRDKEFGTWKLCRKTLNAVKLDLSPCDYIENEDDNEERNTKKRKVKFYTCWYNHAAKTVFDCVTFKPESMTTERELNLWSGPLVDLESTRQFADATYKGIYNIEFTLNFIKNILCNKDDQVYEYVIRWLATILQYPEKEVGTALAFISIEGVGKDLIMCSLLKKVFGTAFLRTSDVNDLVGRFNGTIEGKLVCVFDEADRITGQASSKIKALITDNTTRIEHKNFDVYHVPNFMKLIICSNKIDERIMDVSGSSRRYHNDFTLGELIV